MKHRNPLAVFLFGLITGGIYSLYWNIATKIEMNNQGAQIPTAWLIIIPLVNIWWMWKYSEGVEKVTGGKLSGVLAFLLLLLLGPIGSAVIQDSLNNVGAVSSGSPVAQVAPAPPTASPTYAPPADNTTPPAPTPPTNPAPPTATVG